MNLLWSNRAVWRWKIGCGVETNGFFFFLYMLVSKDNEGAEAEGEEEDYADDDPD